MQTDSLIFTIPENIRKVYTRIEKTSLKLAKKRWSISLNQIHVTEKILPNYIIIYEISVLYCIICINFILNNIKLVLL